MVSNIYPPVYVGGYELGCRDSVDALREKGHDVLVLTSRFPEGVNRVEGHVHRKLTMFLGCPEAWKVIVREIRNQVIFRSYCRKFNPDVIFFWKIADLSLAFIEIARGLGLRCCFYVFDDWIARWRNDRFVEIINDFGKRWGIAIPENLLGLKLRMQDIAIENPMFASHFLWQITEESIGPMKNPILLPWGVDREKYLNHPRENLFPPNRLLYVGQIVPHKGVHVALEAFFLAREQGHPELRLTVVGDTGQQPEYFDSLKSLVTRYGVEQDVEFAGKIERERLPEIYRQHDIFLFSSQWDEPFGLTPLEAMSCGLAVIGTGTGGSSETLRDGYNALLYDRDDASSCARQIVRLLRDPKLLVRLRSNGQQIMTTEYSLAVITERLEQCLKDLIAMPKEV